MKKPLHTKHYICGIDYQHEMEESTADFFSSIEELKKDRQCWPYCGIIELILDEQGKEVSHKWIVKQNLEEE